MSVVPADAPFEHFARWFAEAKAKEPTLPEAMSVATATPDGVPSSRLVLLKDYDRCGFVFYIDPKIAVGTIIRSASSRDWMLASTGWTRRGALPRQITSKLSSSSTKMRLPV